MTPGQGVVAITAGEPLWRKIAHMVSRCRGLRSGVVGQRGAHDLHHATVSQVDTGPEHVVHRSEVEG